IGTEELARFALPLPPLPEQHRIVSKLEELFSRLDAGVEALNAIKLQLKRYRQAVLKAAFEGKLTAEWREAHKGELEPASVLLENIKLERKKSGKYKELPPLDTSNLPELPEGWGWTRVGELGSLIQYGTSDKANEDSRGIPIIRMGNIQDGKLVLDNLKYMPYDYPELNDFLLHDGDILFNRTNSAELVGKSAVYNSSCPKAIFASYLIRIKLKAENYLPEILSNYINSCYGRAYIGSVVSQQVGQANVNGTKLSLMPVPLFPLDEQKKVYEIINLCFSLADKIEEVLQRCLKQSDRLRQSILKTAFEGKLVPQDPSDEPAELLLERIKAERIQKQAATLKPRKKIRNNTSAK
ncbi:MAG: restriction endonuclease subunit S, partial [Dehalococcoidales bacterium]|nr:restriction endonuclease subunit S [Dehalococcoidales bacterium]